MRLQDAEEDRGDSPREKTASANGGAAVKPTPHDALRSILDILRYTAVFPTKRYTSAVIACIASLEEYGFTKLRVKNYWGPGDGYQGINAVFVSPKGLPFELQFHTPESYAMKEEECHSSYRKFQKTNDARKAVQYWEEMVSMWDMVCARTRHSGCLHSPTFRVFPKFRHTGASTRECALNTEGCAAAT